MDEANSTGSKAVKLRVLICATGVAAVSLSVVACGDEALRGTFVGYTPHERYEQALRAADLDQTALGRDWIAAADRALEEAVTIAAPYHEVSYLDATRAAAVGYRLNLHRGQRVTASFEFAGDSAVRVFLDMFVVATGSTGNPVLLTSADSLEHVLDYVARRDGEYLVRIQPELLRGGRYAVTILVGASLAFPVSGFDTSAIRSGFGAPRAGGRRSHDGVDIFAPRGTPVVAAASGYVRRTGTNQLGGKVIWLRDELGRSLYYAHLDSQVVRRNTRVRQGDTLGFVGNTGNARTTPPHLHFGVYERGFGPSDPYPALYQPPVTMERFAGEARFIGVLGRTAGDRVRLRLLPTARAPVVAELRLHTPVRLEAGTGGWYRVSLPNGTAGFVAVRLIEPADQPIRRKLIASGGVLRVQPVLTATALDSVAAGEEVPVLGMFGEFLYVQASSGRTGWLLLDE